MFNWRVIVSDKLSAAENMAIDEAVFNGVMNGTSPPTIRFYDWQKPTASFGYNQVWEKEIDPDLLQEFDFDLVRRPTGGRLVLHYDEVTYAVIAPAVGKLSGNVTQSYSEISRALKEGFSHMGMDVDLEKGDLSAEHQRQEKNPCFTSSSRYELKYKNKKIVGSAQVRKKDVILQHGSILLNHDQSKVADILPGLVPEQRERVRKYLSRKSTSINRNLSEPIDFYHATEHFKIGFETAWEADHFSYLEDFGKSEKKEIRRLILEKYSTADWNKRK
jgi:lipoate-protein ligase A